MDRRHAEGRIERNRGDVALMASRAKIAIQLGRTAVQVACLKPGAFGGPGASAVTREHGVDPDDAAGLGRAVKEALAELGVRGGPAVFALPRSLASTKRIELPSRDRDELPEMVRLAMQRDLPIDAASAEIDFTVTGTTAGGSRVLAVAVPGSLVEFQRAVAAAAGLDVEAITLRCFGTSHLVGRLDPDSVVRLQGVDGLEGDAASGEVASGDPAADEPPALLAVDLGLDELELSVVSESRLRFARGVALPSAETPLLEAENISNEARRTWLSYRISQGDERVAALIVLGDYEIARLAVPQLSASIGLPSRLLRRHPELRGEDEAIASAWPLLGLLLERRQEREVLDFAHPKRPPDLARRRRMRAVASLGMIGIAAFGGWTIGSRSFATAEARADELEGSARKALADFLRLKRDRLRLGHLEAWTSVEPSWLDHALAIEGFLPERDAAVIDVMRGGMEISNARYRRGEGFAIDAGVRLIVEGEARDRGEADALRDRIVEDRRYRLRSTGADARGGRRLPIPFAFELRSAADSPASAESESAEATATSTETGAAAGEGGDS
jgi:hypothetical protein